jgi:outer membrane protein TolC
MSESAHARRRDVLTEVRNAWFEGRYWSDAHAIVSETRPFFEELVTVARSLYSVGRKNQQDVLRAELELARLDNRLIEIDEQRARARAALSEWLGDAAYRPLANTEPSWQQLPPPERMRAALGEHPALVAAEARIDARNAEVDLAKERFKPGWALDVGYGYRDGLLPNGNPRSDFVSVSVTVDLPLFRKNRQDRSLRAALSERRAADASKEALRRRLARQLEAEYARWQQIDRRVELYEKTILIQANDQAQAALSAYQSDAGDFADVMRGRIDELTARLEHTRLQVEQAQSYAVLANLGGFTR